MEDKTNYHVNLTKMFHFFLPPAKQRVSARRFSRLRRAYLQLCLINSNSVGFPPRSPHLTLPLILIKCAMYKNMIRHRTNLIARFVSSIYCISRCISFFFFFRLLHALDGDYCVACLLLTDKQNRSQIRFFFLLIKRFARPVESIPTSL